MMYSLGMIIQMNKRPGATNLEAITEAHEAAKPYQPTGEYISKATVRDSVISQRERTSIMDWLRKENPEQWELRDPTPPYIGTCELCKANVRLEYREDHAIWICGICDYFVDTPRGMKYLEDRQADLNTLVNHGNTQTPEQWKAENKTEYKLVKHAADLDYQRMNTKTHNDLDKEPCHYCKTTPTMLHSVNLDLCQDCFEFSFTDDGEKYRIARAAAVIIDQVYETPEQWQSRHETTEKAEAILTTVNMEA